MNQSIDVYAMPVYIDKSHGVCETSVSQVSKAACDLWAQ